MTLPLTVIISLSVLSIFVWGIALFLLNFYRDPERKIPKGSNIVSPADGKVISILDTYKNPHKIKKGIFGKIRTLTKDVGKKCHAISIFMSPFDAHYNRSPIEGIVSSVRHSKGRFFKAYQLEKSMENEKNEILIRNNGIKVKVIQIAGFLARRIKCYVKRNQKVNKGEKIGMIALSSQTTLIIPASAVAVLNVKVGDKVKAGETIIANLRQITKFEVKQ